MNPGYVTVWYEPNVCVYLSRTSGQERVQYGRAVAVQERRTARGGPETNKKPYN
jgi:hypothetical protein